MTEIPETADPVAMEGPYKCCCQHHPVATGCPDDKPGCCVLHMRADGCPKDAYREAGSDALPICDGCEACPVEA